MRFADGSSSNFTDKFHGTTQARFSAATVLLSGRFGTSAV
jgi:hypothetical protein